MASRKNESKKEVPTQEQIVEYILEWKDKPYEYVLQGNQFTAKSLSDQSGLSLGWCKDTLKALFDEGKCSRERVIVRSGGWFYVYTFKELPTF